jgi:hypothetical protein
VPRLRARHGDDAEGGEAQRCADLLGASIPGASHINHMPSHTYNRVGRWGDATRANIEAWQTDQRAGGGDGFAIYPAHNLHMLLFSASVDGQGAIAAQAARDYTKLVPATARRSWRWCWCGSAASTRCWS